MKLSTYIAENPDIWDEVKLVYDFPFIDDTGVTTLNLLLDFKYGKRDLFIDPSMSSTLLAHVLVAEFQQKWLDIIAVESVADVTISKTKTITEDVETTDSRTSEREDVNKVAAYNSNTMVSADGVDSETLESGSGTVERVNKTDWSSVSELYGNLSIRQKDYIINTVMADFAAFTTLSIY